jgi:hypothetical protein
MDKNNDGSLSLKELLPLVFSKAGKDQLRSILYHCQREIVCKKDVSKGRGVLIAEDLDELFNFYDSDLVGFVAVGTIRDQVKGLELPRQAEEFILRPILGIYLVFIWYLFGIYVWYLSLPLLPLLLPLPTPLDII